MTILTCKFRIKNSKIQLMLRNEVLNLKFSQIIENYTFLILIKKLPGIPGISREATLFPGIGKYPGIPGEKL